jgi:hypothetical protein
MRRSALFKQTGALEGIPTALRRFSVFPLFLSAFPDTKMIYFPHIL